MEATTKTRVSGGRVEEVGTDDVSLSRGNGGKVDDPNCPVSARKFYSVYIPPEAQAQSKDKSKVVHTLKEANELFKRNPLARFRIAATEEEAWADLEEENALKYGPPTLSTVDTLVSPPYEVNTGREMNAASAFNTSPQSLSVSAGGKRRGRLSLPAANCLAQAASLAPGAAKLAGEEKDTRFPTPRIQDLTAMAREITAKNNAAVLNRINANPKMLISDCDRPTTVQPGCHYNALHMAAKCNNAEIIACILDKVGSQGFMEWMYPAKDVDALHYQMKHMSDAYLNTPDKMSTETPLHFACKFLAVEAAEVLIQHPWCNLTALNSCDETPLMIVGTRADHKVSGFSKKVEAVRKMFSDVYIVPIWRNPYSMEMPTAGAVAQIRDLGQLTPKPLLKHFPNFNMILLPPCDKGLLPESRTRIHEDLDEWKVSAFAGPSAKENAEDLVSLLRHPRSTSVNHDSPYATLSFSSSGESFVSASIVDNDQQGETERRLSEVSSLRTPTKITLTRYSVTPTRSPFNSNFNNSITSNNTSSASLSPRKGPPFLDFSSYQRRRDMEKGFERHAMMLAKDCELPWSEEWTAIDYFGNICSDEGLAKFNDVLQANDFDNTENEAFEDSIDSLSSSKSNNEGEDKYFDSASYFRFIDGYEPGKRDFQLYSVLKDHEENIVFEKFPLVFQWFNSVKSSGFVAYDDRRAFELSISRCISNLLNLTLHDDSP